MVKKAMLVFAVLSILVVKSLGDNYSRCQYDRAVTMAKVCGRIGAFVPSCEKDGSYSLVQCSGSTGYCWCVNPFTGIKISPPVRGKRPQCIEHEITECEFQNAVATAKQDECKLVGVYIPQCQGDGSFVRKQCWASTGYCCCVDPITGKMTSNWTRADIECPLIVKPPVFYAPAVVLALEYWSYLSANNSGYMYFQSDDFSKAYTFRSTGFTLYPLIGVCLMAQVTFPEQKLFLVPVEYCSTKPGARVVPSLRYNPNSNHITDNTGMCLGIASKNTAVLSWSSCDAFTIISPNTY